MLDLQPDLFIPTQRGRFAARAMGPAEGPAVLLLHGFPDGPGTFAELMPALAAAGFRAVAPWLRGYAPSPLTGEFGPTALGADLLALGDALGATRVIGHDWGALAVYAALALAPQKLSAAVTLAVPNIYAAMRNAPRTPPTRQLWRSRYILLFQIPGAERWLRRRDFAYVDTLWRRWSPALPPPAAHLRAVKAGLLASGVAPLTHYREMVRGLAAGIPRPPLSTTPVLYLAGTADGCIGWELGRDQGQWFTKSYTERIYPGAGHFLHLERPREVAADILAWLPSQDATAGR